MLNDFANEIEEIIHLAGGGNATLAQVRQDLAGIVERMRAAQQPRALDKCQHCNGAGVLMTAIGSKLCPRCEGSGTCQ